MPMPKWIELAQKEIGQREVRGGENPRIIEYHATTSYGAKEDEIPWCASFVNWCITKAGLKGTGSAAARSWEHWGQALDAPTPGAVVTFWGDKPNTPAAHVGFYMGPGNTPETISVLGGNQGDAVCSANFSKSRVIAYRWPSEIELPGQPDIVVTEDYLRQLRDEMLSTAKTIQGWAGDIEAALKG